MNFPVAQNIIYFSNANMRNLSMMVIYEMTKPSFAVYKNFPFFRFCVTFIIKHCFDKIKRNVTCNYCVKEIFFVEIGKIFKCFLKKNDFSSLNTSRNYLSDVKILTATEASGAKT